MTHALKGRKQSPEHIAARISAMSSHYEKIRTGRSLESKQKSYAATKEWRLKNQDKVKAHKQKFQENKRDYRAFYEMTRHSNKKNATPKWANLYAVAGMYELCGLFKGIGLDIQVDHIIPLNGELVSGLHVANNLQLLNRIKNIQKKNRFSLDSQALI